MTEKLVVESCGPDWAETSIAVGGPLSERKGVTVVGAVLPLSPLTEKDRHDLTFALDMGADWIALSFVQRPQDMQELRDLVKGRAGVMAKIEKPAAMECLDEIVALSDGIMVARISPDTGLREADGRGSGIPEYFYEEFLPRQREDVLAPGISRPPSEVRNQLF